MSKLKSFGLVILAMIALIAMFPIAGQSSIKKVGEKAGPDRIVIQLENALEKNEMPPVGFLHDFHTKAVGDTCTKCHTEEKDGTVFKFKRVEGQATMELYHDNCVACHAEKKSAGEPFGPLTAECRSCHADKQPAESTWSEIQFDKALHYIHESSAQIKTKVSSEKDNCSQCHHQYNVKSKETFFTKGQEEACIYCHKSEKKDDIRGLRNASHDSCVKCHQSLKTKNISAGPVNCAGCHDETLQAKIDKPAQTPRMKRNQPDVIAITGWKKGGKEKSSFMNAVAFNHEFHEAKAQSCKTCHHETLKKCSDCHSTDGGDEKGGFVSLEKAMHNKDSSRSCVGCHQQTAATQNCAGCHAIMPQAAQGSASCTTCHSLKTDQIETMGAENAAKGALAAMDARYTKVAVDKIPEAVTIGLLSKDYKPSQFPHRKVVQAIIEKVEANQMAKSFHGDQAGLCMGCHHNSPKTLDPPKCASCHSKNGSDSDGRPGLKGAYHGQCITCHQEMAVQTVLATDCVKCHEEKK